MNLSALKTIALFCLISFFFTAPAPAADDTPPSSPVNNPSMYEGVMLHSGEFVMEETDLRIPGRGFDFVFTRTYRSRILYSGILGANWDHTYNRRNRARCVTL